MKKTTKNDNQPTAATAPSTRTTVTNLMVIVGMLVLAVMALLPLLDINQPWMRWVYAGGAVLVLVARLFQPAPAGSSMRVKRLYRIIDVSAMFYCASAAIALWRPGGRDWLAFLLAGAVLQLYATFTLEHVARKESAASEKSPKQRNS